MVLGPLQDGIALMEWRIKYRVHELDAIATELKESSTRSHRNLRVRLVKADESDILVVGILGKRSRCNEARPQITTVRINNVFSHFRV
jgi:hypothetical protein